MDVINSFSGPYRFLSNYWVSPIVINGKQYLTVEHAYQSFKTKDLSTRETIRLSKTPGNAKALGKPPEKGGIVILRDDWNEIKVSVMTTLIKLKFRIPELRKKLLATGDAMLIEGNTWGDTFWGVCDGNGKNMLGKILVAERTEIRWFV